MGREFELKYCCSAEDFEALKAAIAPIGRALFVGLEWAWHNLLVPLAAWTAEKILPAFLI
mgnify:CR=1 FL=1